MAVHRLSWLILAAVLPACGASAHAPRAKVHDDFAGLDWEQRHDVMTFVVLPNMGRLFQSYRRTAAPDLTCESCHGEDAEAIGYRMPNGRLAALDAALLPKAGDSPMAKFMIERVTPEMSELIAAPVTCFSCHPQKPK
jgi:hypothetical protein